MLFQLELGCMRRSMTLCTLALAATVACFGAGLTSGMAGNPTRIHPGDQLSVQVFGDPSLTQNVTVLGDGTVEYPLIGRVGVAGKTPDQAAAAFAARLRQYVRNPTVTVSIAQLGQPNVLVLGDVKLPGKYQLRSDAKLTDAIAAAGGLVNTNGAFPDARVADSSGNIRSVSLQSLLQRGNTSLDVALGEGSVVYIPGPVQFIVEVAGAVDHPGEIQLNEGDHLSVAVAKAGNSQNAQADLNHIRVIRNDSDGKRSTMQVNLYDAINRGDQSADVALQKGDVIYVPQASKHTDIFSGIGSGILFLLTHIIP